MRSAICHALIVLGALSVFIFILLFAGCAGHIPSEDIYFRVYTPRGLEVMKMEKGYLDEINKGKAWMFCKDREGIK